MSTWISVLALFVSIMSLAITVFRSMATSAGAAAAQKTAKINLIAQLFDGYASKDMLAALRAFEDWGKKHPDPNDSVEAFGVLEKAFRPGDGTPYDLDAHRRMIIHYMNKVRFLSDETNYIPPGLKRLLCECTLTTKTVDILWPIQKSLGHPESDLFGYWKKTFPASKQKQAATSTT